MAAAVATSPTMATPKPEAAAYPYTCNTCKVAFKGSELQRQHMQTDWHRYNLKCKGHLLSTVTSEEFAKKVLANQATAAATAAQALFEKNCTVCQRTYFSRNTYLNHLQSQKHKNKVAQLSHGEDMETEAESESMASSAFSLGDSVQLPIRSVANEETSDADVAELGDSFDQTSLRHNEDLTARQSKIPSLSNSSISTTSPLTNQVSSTSAAEPTLQCLFCNTVSSSITSNVTHMSKTHGLFIPEQVYLVDLPGLISYLHDRVHALHECLYCGQIKYTTSGIQTHMRDKGHCMIAFESEAEMVEVGEFYDFSNTYSDDESEEDTEEDHEPTRRRTVDAQKLGAPRKETGVAEDGSGEDFEDGEWESEEEEEDEGEDGDTHAQGSADRPPRPSRNQAYRVDNELYLPSGRVAGHRSFSRYFRQNLHNYPSAIERNAQQQLLEDVSSDSSVPHNSRRDVMARGRSGREVVSRAGGGLGLLGAPEDKKRLASKQELKEKKRATRLETWYRAGNERRGNQQKHYRDPLLQ